MKRTVPYMLMAGVAAIAVSAAGCGGSDDGGGGAKADAYTMAMTEPDHIVPGETTSAYSIQVDEGLFDNLVRLDANGKPHNLEAQSITSSDQQTWTIKLKPGLKFSNGEPVTSHSYVDAWNATAYGPHGWASNYYFANIKGYDALNPDKGKPKTKTLSGLKVVNDTTFKVTLNTPFSQFPLTLAYNGFAPLPKEAFSGKKSFETSPIGNGPYMMAKPWQRDKQIVLKQNPNYTGPRKPHADKVTFKIYASDDAAYTDLQAGNVDIDDSIPAAKQPEAKSTFGDRFKTVPSGTFDYLGFPLYEKKYDNVDLRRAISMAINRKAITQAVYNGTFKPMGSLFPPIVPGYRDNPCGQYCQYNPTKAKQLLQKAGGFTGTMNLWLSNSDPTYQRWMQAVANQLKQNLGITCKLRQVATADYLSTIADQKEDGPYRSNWVVDYPSPQNYLQTQFGAGNHMGWSGPDHKQFKKLIGQANAAPSFQASLPIYQKAEDVALKDLPMIPLWNWQSNIAWSKNIAKMAFDSYVGVHLEGVQVKTS